MKLFTLAQIAKGGMGTVELARADEGRFAGHAFAIKRLHEQIAKDPQFVAMFLDETWMTASLTSPNVVRVAAWGTDERGMFLAVELVRGIALSKLLKEARRSKETFAERTVAFIGSELCAGLAAAHALRGADGSLLGLVHRDLTPSNVLISFDGEVKIVDFGIAKAEQRITQTQAGDLKGKPGYMAPEQSRGGKVDARSDLFSMGVLLFELLTGRRPWVGATPFEVMLAAMTQPPADLLELRKGCNPLFAQIINKCLAKDPDERFSSADEIQALLDGFRREKGFDADDRASLAQFARRNCAKQIEWFERALRGDFAERAAPTFQELQEQIEEAREKSGEGGDDSAQPASGRAALLKMSPDAPKPVQRPMAEPGENDPTRVYVPPSVRSPSSARGAMLAGAAAPPSAGGLRVTPPGAGPALLTRKGTELMPEQDPLASPVSRPAPSSTPSPSSARAPAGPLVASPASARRGIELLPDSKRGGAPVIVDSAAAPDSKPPASAPPPSSPSPSSPSSSPTSQPSSSPTSQPSSAPRASSGARRQNSASSRAAALALLILLPLLAAFAIWQFRARILAVSGVKPAASPGAAPSPSPSTSPVDRASASGQPVPPASEGSSASPPAAEK